MKAFMIGAILVAFCVLCAWAADEINVTATLKVENGNFDLTRRIQNYSVDQTGTAADYQIAVATTSATNTLTVNNVTAPGYCFFRNLDATSNSVIVSLTMMLRAGDVAILPLQSTNITYYSTNGNANLEVWLNQE